MTNGKTHQELSEHGSAWFVASPGTVPGSEIWKGEPCSGMIAASSAAPYISLGQDPEILQLKEELERLKKERMHPMKTLFEVIIVTIDEEVIARELVVAEDDKEASLAADVPAILRKHGVKLKDVTIFVMKIGLVKVRKPTQKVQIVKDEGE